LTTQAKATVKDTGETLTFGSIVVNDTDFTTPDGTHPLEGSRWVTANNITAHPYMPKWAIVCMILLMPVFGLGLLFVLVRRYRLDGTVDVTIRQNDDEIVYKEMIKPETPYTAQRVKRWAEQAQARGETLKKQNRKLKATQTTLGGEPSQTPAP
jgi:hypothetical protein